MQAVAMMEIRTQHILNIQQECRLLYRDVGWYWYLLSNVGWYLLSN